MAAVRISSLQAFHLKIRLRKPIRHASHVRTENDTLIIRCELNNGVVGWGESLPRSYVTGETIDSAWGQLAGSDFSFLTQTDIQNPGVVARKIADWQPSEFDGAGCNPAKSGFGNSVRCAVELACLDAGCRSEGISMGDAVHFLAQPLDLCHESAVVRYSGVITSSTRRLSQLHSALKMKLFGFHSVKLKVGRPDINDMRLTSMTRRVIGAQKFLRVDVNEAWTPEQAVAKIRALVPFGIESVEQPVADSFKASLAEIRRAIDVPIVLDESMCSLDDARIAAKNQLCDSFNIRLSKCGGIWNSLQMMKIAQENGLAFQLGCMVGETGILSAAGRHFACTVGPFENLEGCYDRFVVQDSLTMEDMTFGYGGKANRPQGSGLAVTVDESQVQARTQKTMRCL